jgi:PHAX RNA-binding domain
LKISSFATESIMDDESELLYYSDDDADVDEFTRQLAALGIDESAELSEEGMDCDDDHQQPQVAIVAAPAPVGQFDHLLSGALATPRTGSSNGATGANNPPEVQMDTTTSTNSNAAPRKTVREVARWVCEQLGEPKYYLMCQVVYRIGHNKTKRLIAETHAVEAAGGMLTADNKRRRSPGGTFLTLLKGVVSAKKLKAIYADDNMRKRKQERAKRAASLAKAVARISAAAAEAAAAAAAQQQNEEGQLTSDSNAIMDDRDQAIPATATENTSTKHSAVSHEKVSAYKSRGCRGGVKKPAAAAKSTVRTES